MRIALFSHSLLSDWNHGSAHFLRGVVTELARRGHDVLAYEPLDAWSVKNLVADQGTFPLSAVRQAYPWLSPVRYDPAGFDAARAVDGADAVLVHERNDPALVAELGRVRRRGGRFALLFHDTHHRAITHPKSMAAYDLSGYDGVLAFGKVLRDFYIERSLTQRAWVWHEAADTTVFRPFGGDERRARADLAFVSNWGDGERDRDLAEFLLSPVADLRLTATVYGVRYPAQALTALAAAGAGYRGWVPNYRVPRVYGEHRFTVHVPRSPYARALPGIPTIRVFEALACGIPLVCAPWDDAEGLFTSGEDYLLARSGAEMKRHLALLSADRDFARGLAEHGRSSVLRRHTCVHRVDELLAFLSELRVHDAARAPLHDERRAS